MAKVGVECITHKGSGKEIYCQVNFVNKTKLFVISDFPDVIKEWYGSKLTRDNTYGHTVHNGGIYAKSYDECVALAKKVYSDYYDLRISEEKIICYQLKTNHPRPEFHGHNNRRDIYHAPSLAIGIEYRVMYRVMVGEEAFISPTSYEESRNSETGVKLSGPRLSRENGDSGLRDWHKIPYSEEAHNFFMSVEKGLNDLIIKTNNFFGESPSHLLDKIESGKLLT